MCLLLQIKYGRKAGDDSEIEITLRKKKPESWESKWSPSRERLPPLPAIGGATVALPAPSADGERHSMTSEKSTSNTCTSTSASRDSGGDSGGSDDDGHDSSSSEEEKELEED